MRATPRPPGGLCRRHHNRAQGARGLQLSLTADGFWQSAVYDNTSLIAEIIACRRPALLLCAGWTVPTEESVAHFIAVTQWLNTVLLLETCGPPPINFRIADGRLFPMGIQFFAERDKTQEADHRALAAALPVRTFPFSGRTAFLLVCGEVEVAFHRQNVDFHPFVPPAVRAAVRAHRSLILNPTHTRMKNDGTDKAWRKWLSSDGRVYVSASNWDLAKQHPSDTLHSLWHDGESATPTYRLQNTRMYYREWLLPA